MNKRAAFPIAIILGLVVIALVGYGIVSVGYNYAKEKFFGEEGVLPGFGEGEEGFVPYEGPPLTNEEMIVLDSMNALACAISVTAKGNADYSVCAPQRGVKKEDKKEPESKDIAKAPATTGDAVTGMQTAEQKTCAGHQYGNSCVQCGSAHVPGGSLQDKISFETFNQFLLSCVWQSDFASEDTFCGRIPAYSLESSTITKKDIDDWFKKNAPDQVKTALNKDFFFTLDPSPINHKKDYYICADDDGWDNEIYIYDDYTKDNDCFDSYVSWVDAKGNYYDQTCTVTSFELPQQATTIDEWIPQARDPKYIAYYEAFPIGEEAYWQLDEGSFLIDVVFFGAVLNAVPVVGRGIAGMVKGAYKGLSTYIRGASKLTVDQLREKAIRELSEELGKKMSKEMAERAARELYDIFGEAGYQRLIKQDLLHEALITKIGNKIGDDAADKISADAFDLLRENAIERALGRPALSTDEIIDLLKQQSDNLLQGSDDATRAIAREEIERIIRSPIDDSMRQAFTRKSAIRQYFGKQLLDIGDDGVIKGFRADALSKLLSREVGSEVLERLPSEASEQYLKRASSYMDDILLKQGDEYVINYAKILGTADQGVITNVQNQFKLFFRETYGSPSQWQGLIPQLSSPLKLGQPITVLGLKIPIISRAGGAMWATAKTNVKNINELVWRNRIGRYVTAFLIADALATADSINEKYAPHGKDNLVLTTPFMFELSKTFPVTAATNFYVDVLKDDDSHQRLFFASPCKADLSVTQSLGTCKVPHKAQVIKSEAYTIPVEAGSVALLSGKSMTPRYVYDELSDETRNRAFDKCFNVWMPDSVYGECVGLITTNPEYLEQFLQQVYNKVYIPATDAIRSGRLIIRFVGGLGVDWQLLPEGTPTDSEMNAYRILTNVVGGRVGGGDYDALFEEKYWLTFFLNPETISAVRTDPSRWQKPVPLDKQLSFEQFKEHMVPLYKRRIAPVLVQEHMIKFLASNAPETLNNELRQSNTFASVAARKTYYHYYMANINDIRSEDMIKFCTKSQSAQDEDPFGNIVTINTPIVQVDHDERAYPNYNEGYNYCGSRYLWWTDWVKGLALGMALAIDVAVGLVPGVGWIAEAGVAMLTGAGSAWVADWMDSKYQWPQ